jgi:hypothetical protein
LRVVPASGAIHSAITPSGQPWSRARVRWGRNMKHRENDEKKEKNKKKGKKENFVFVRTPRHGGRTPRHGVDGQKVNK